MPRTSCACGGPERSWRSVEPGGFVHTAYEVRTAVDIPAVQLDSARNFILAYALDGEFLPKVRGDEAIISLDVYDAHNLYRLLSRIVSLNKYRERIGSIAKATDSMPLKDLYSQLQESQLTYRQLDKKLGAQLLQAHRALGCNSGYRERGWLGWDSRSKCPGSQLVRRISPE